MGCFRNAVFPWYTMGMPEAVMNTRRVAILITLVSIGLVPGCGATRGAAPPTGKGFLDDYSKLEKGPEGGAKLEFIDPGADWKAYDRIIIDPVTFWRGSDVKANLSPEQRQMLANYMHARMREELENDYRVVETPAKGAMRLTSAFTRLGGRNVTMDTVSTVVPQVRLMSEAKGMFTGKPSFVGEAAIELRVTDSWTGQVLGAAVDRRVGGKTIKGMDTWADVRAAMDHWAKVARYRLCNLRAEGDCPAP